jgi:type IV secretory pathway TraG/TraD family ATPase VirD4
MRLAIFATSRPEGDTAPTWFVADELDATGKIKGLDDALQRIRKFGGRCVLGFQTIGKVRAPTAMALPRHWWRTVAPA